MTVSSPLVLSLAIVGAGIVAGIVPFFFKWTHRTAHSWIAFGAGAILGTAFIHMIPEGYGLAGPTSISMALLGFLLLYGVEQLLLTHPHEEREGELHEMGILAFLGLSIHDFIDGVALGAAPTVPELTPAIFLALILHKIPTTFSLSLLMLHAGYRKAAILSFLGVMLAAIPMGALVSSLLLAGTAHQDVLVGRLIIFSAGTFLYIGAYELLPEMHRQSEKSSRIGLYFIAGLLSMSLLRLVHVLH